LNWPCNRQARTSKTALHSSRRPPLTLQCSANMHPSNRLTLTFQNQIAKGRTSFSLQRHSSHHQTLPKTCMPRHLWTRTQIQIISTIPGWSFWRVIVLRSRGIRSYMSRSPFICLLRRRSFQPSSKATLPYEAISHSKNHISCVLQPLYVVASRHA
jgi:hypothetical protein